MEKIKLAILEELIEKFGYVNELMYETVDIACADFGNILYSDRDMVKREHAITKGSCSCGASKADMTPLKDLFKKEAVYVRQNQDGYDEGTKSIPGLTKKDYLDDVENTLNDHGAVNTRDASKIYGIDKTPEYIKQAK